MIWAYWDLGFQGCSDIPTPHLDARLLAGRALHLRLCQLLHVLAHAARGCSRAVRSLASATSINWKPLPGTEPLRPAARREKLWPTSSKARRLPHRIVGKWHLGESPQFHPNRRGFEEFFGFVGGGTNFFCETYTKTKTAIVSAPRTQRARPRKRQANTSPRFSVASCVLHPPPQDRALVPLRRFQRASYPPLQATPELLARVKTIPNEQRRTYVSPWSAGSMTRVARSCASSATRGWRTARWSFFLSDNGGPLDRATVSRNDPLRGEKGTFWEGGIRVPFVASWKGVLPAGKKYDRPVTASTFVPTALALASADSMTDPSRSTA
jgi:arylsulfatase A-like enzyme